MFIVVFHLMLCAAIGCTPVDTGKTYRTAKACEHAKHHRTDICAIETDVWLSK